MTNDELVEVLNRVARSLEGVGANLARALEIDESRRAQVIIPPETSMIQKVYDVKYMIETARLIDPGVRTPQEAAQIIREWHAVLTEPSEDKETKVPDSGEEAQHGD
jgi:hypothetical protein